MKTVQIYRDLEKTLTYQGLKSLFIDVVRVDAHTLNRYQRFGDEHGERFYEDVLYYADILTELNPKNDINASNFRRTVEESGLLGPLEVHPQDKSGFRTLQAAFRYLRHSAISSKKVLNDILSIKNKDRQNLHMAWIMCEWGMNGELLEAHEARKQFLSFLESFRSQDRFRQPDQTERFEELPVRERLKVLAWQALGFAKNDSVGALAHFLNHRSMYEDLTKPPSPKLNV